MPTIQQNIGPYTRIPSHNPMLAVRELHKTYGPIRALRGVSFDLPGGTVVGLLGPNGAGKSTTIKIVTGSIPPDCGSVEIAGRSAESDPKAARARIGYLPESAPLYPEMRVIDLLRFRCRLFGMGGKSAKSAIEREIDRCWLAEVKSRRIGQLSKGFRQRVGLATALVHDPDIVILDEPSNGLDPSQIRAMRELVRALGERKLVLLSSHILAEVELTCDRVLVLAQGELRADGTPHDLAEAVGGPYRLEVKGQAEPLLRELAGVESIDTEALGDGWTRLLIAPGPGAGDLREAIANACRGMPIRELTRERGSLERAFVRALTAERTAQPEEAA